MNNKYFYLTLLTGITFYLPAQNPWFRENPAVGIMYNGKSLPNAWAGGLNAPQYATMFLNDDDTPDLVVFDRTQNKVSTFLGNAGLKAWEYAPQYESRFPAIQHWMQLVDYDQDGEKELFTHHPQGIAVYRKKAEAGSWIWETDQPLLYTENISGQQTALSVTSTDIPAITDIDGDGDIDIVTFEILGDYAQLHLNQSVEKYGSPDKLEFKLNGQCWGNFMKHSCDSFDHDMACDATESGRMDNYRTQHAGNAVMLYDLNGDQKKDMILGIVSCDNLSLLINEGSNRVADFKTSTADFPPSYPVNMPSFPAAYMEDVTFDGIPDLLVAPNVSVNEGNQINFSSSGWLYENTGSAAIPEFTLVQKDFLQELMLDAGEYAAPLLADIDGDGLTDLLIGTAGTHLEGSYKGTIWLLKNTGTSQQPKFEVRDQNYLNISANDALIHIRPQWADFNGDGVPDLGFSAIAGRQLRYYYIPNKAAKGQPAQFNPAERVTYPIPANLQLTNHLYFYDGDQDGDLDLVIGGVQGNIFYYQNNGTAAAPVFSLVTESLGNISINFSARYVKVAVADLDMDGQADLIYTDNSGKISVLSEGPWNAWTKKEESIATLSDNKVTGPLGWELIPALADLNNDSKPDLIIGTQAGGIRHFENIKEGKVTGIDPGEAWELTVSPNPANERVTIKSNKTARLSVYNISGSEITTPLNSIEYGKPGFIEINQWQPGIYFLQFTFENQVLVKKLVVQ